MGLDRTALTFHIWANKIAAVAKGPLCTGLGAGFWPFRSAGVLSIQQATQDAKMWRCRLIASHLQRQRQY